MEWALRATQSGNVWAVFPSRITVGNASGMLTVCHTGKRKSKQKSRKRKAALLSRNWPGFDTVFRDFNRLDARWPGPALLQAARPPDQQRCWKSRGRHNDGGGILRPIATACVDLSRGAESRPKLETYIRTDGIRVFLRPSQRDPHSRCPARIPE